MNANEQRLEHRGRIGQIDFVSSVPGILSSLPSRAARALILMYRVSFSMIAGRFCRYAPTCSQYADEAIARHGLRAGGWMALARVCRCRPGGGEGYDPVPERLRADVSPLTPWRYGVWRVRPTLCEKAE